MPLSSKARLQAIAMVLAATTLALPLAQPFANEPGRQTQAPASPPKLILPIDCQPGVNCFIQSYVDMKPGEGVRDPNCGHATNDGHKGTDIRLLSAAAAENLVPIRAAAPGIIKGTRDGMRDILLRDIATDPKARAAIRNRECGNGVAIDHGNGWETQYCHMRANSVRVTNGQRVKRGALLGHVGYSGSADFAHLHVSVRHNGKTIDPFTGSPPSHACTGRNQRSSHIKHENGLWSPGAVDGFPYQTGRIIASGFAGIIVNKDDLERGPAPPIPDAHSPVLVFYARFINVEKADRITIRISGPGGFNPKSPPKTLTRNRASQMVFVGKKLKSDRWPAGQYRAQVELHRRGKVHARQQQTLNMN